MILVLKPGHIADGGQQSQCDNVIGPRQGHQQLHLGFSPSEFHQLLIHHDQFLLSSLQFSQLAVEHQPILR